LIIIATRAVHLDAVLLTRDNLDHNSNRIEKSELHSEKHSPNISTDAGIIKKFNLVFENIFTSIWFKINLF
jgi:hypothetical protein